MHSTLYRITMYRVRAAMATKPKMMLFSHVCNTRSITGAEKLLLHFMREIGTIFECVLVVPQEEACGACAKIRHSGQNMHSADASRCVHTLPGHCR